MTLLVRDTVACPGEEIYLVNMYVQASAAVIHVRMLLYEQLATFIKATEKDKIHLSVCKFKTYNVTSESIHLEPDEKTVSLSTLMATSTSRPSESRCTQAQIPCQQE